MRLLCTNCKQLPIEPIASEYIRRLLLIWAAVTRGGKTPVPAMRAALLLLPLLLATVSSIQAR